MFCVKAMCCIHGVSVALICWVHSVCIVCVCCVHVWFYVHWYVLSVCMHTPMDTTPYSYNTTHACTALQRNTQMQPTHTTLNRPGSIPRVLEIWLYPRTCASLTLMKRSLEDSKAEELIGTLPPVSYTYTYGARLRPTTLHIH